MLSSGLPVMSMTEVSGHLHGATNAGGEASGGSDSEGSASGSLAAVSSNASTAVTAVQSQLLPPISKAKSYEDLHEYHDREEHPDLAADRYGHQPQLSPWAQKLRPMQGMWETTRHGGLRVQGDLVIYDGALPGQQPLQLIEAPDGRINLSSWLTDVPTGKNAALLWMRPGGRSADVIVWTRRAPPAEAGAPPPQVSLQLDPLMEASAQELEPVQGRWETSRFGPTSVVGALVTFDVMRQAGRPPLRLMRTMDGRLALDAWRAEEIPIDAPLAIGGNGTGSGARCIRWTHVAGGQDVIFWARPVTFDKAGPGRPLGSYRTTPRPDKTIAARRSSRESRNGPLSAAEVLGHAYKGGQDYPGSREFDVRGGSNMGALPGRVDEDAELLALKQVVQVQQQQLRKLGEAMKKQMNKPPTGKQKSHYMPAGRRQDVHDVVHRAEPNFPRDVARGPRGKRRREAEADRDFDEVSISPETKRYVKQVTSKHRTHYVPPVSAPAPAPAPIRVERSVFCALK
mmetsp:Transcript_43016/g.93660  ORF Transcript_43016/g.93660 Transcript_43016/m.93660 type:complete len:513 (-) Transcript_43016:1464-3002(-)